MATYDDSDDAEFMELFSAFDDVVASADLKERTLAAVRVSKAQSALEKTAIAPYVSLPVQNTAVRPVTRAKAPVRRRLHTGVFAALACVLVLVVGFVSWFTPITSVRVEQDEFVVDLGVNVFGVTVQAKAEGSEGEAVLETEHVTNLAFDESERRLRTAFERMRPEMADGKDTHARTSDSSDDPADGGASKGADHARSNTESGTNVPDGTWSGSQGQDQQVIPQPAQPDHGAQTGQPQQSQPQQSQPLQDQPQQSQPPQDQPQQSQPPLDQPQQSQPQQSQPPQDQSQSQPQQGQQPQDQQSRPEPSQDGANQVGGGQQDVDGGQGQQTGQTTASDAQPGPGDSGSTGTDMNMTVRRTEGAPQDVHAGDSSSSPSEDQGALGTGGGGGGVGEAQTPENTFASTGDGNAGRDGGAGDVGPRDMDGMGDARTVMQQTETVAQPMGTAPDGM